MKLVELDIVANGIRLHVYRTGNSKPPLVFAHGITDNGLCFTPIAEPLSNEFEIILFDSRNHGKSESPAGKTTLVDRAMDLAGLVDALQLQRPGLIGHSLGAVTAGLTAGLYPSLPGCIVLEDPPPFELFAPREENSSSNPKTWLQMADLNKKKTVEELMDFCRCENPAWPESELLHWAESKQQLSLAVFDEEQIGVEQGNKLFSKITCPTLILTADADRGALYPPQAADTLAAGLPVARHVHLPGAGHSIRREQPAAYLKAVDGFLKEFL
ncbi:MAG: alpha/beta hydrolase [Anaerolineales bacterium]|nr:alpha/beta hydrolase [Anaerolineales bacterium]